MKKTITLFALCIGILFTNCTLQKRHYMKGYNVAVNKANNQNTSIGLEANQATNISASTSKEISFINNSATPTITYNEKIELPGDSCDIIKLNNNKILKAKVTEINPHEIHFRLCDARGIGKREIIFAKERIESITFSNGTVEIITPLETQSSNNNCIDTIYLKQSKIKAYVYKINRNSIFFNLILENGQLKDSVIRKNKVFKINFCEGTMADYDALKRVKSINTDRKEWANSQFWNKYSYDIILIKDPNNRQGTIRNNGYVTEIASDSIKFILYDTTQHQEVKISSKDIHTIFLQNGERLWPHEIEQLNKKISSNSDILKYAKSIERKQTLVKDLSNKSFHLGIAAILLPIIGISFALKAIKNSNISRKIIKTTPELKKYKLKAYIGQTLGILGIIISGIVLIIGLWYLIFDLGGVSIM